MMFSFWVCFVLLFVGFVVGFCLSWVRGFRLRWFVARLFVELRSGEVFSLKFDGVRKKFKCVEVGDDGKIVGS